MADLAAEVGPGRPGRRGQPADPRATLFVVETLLALAAGATGIPVAGGGGAGPGPPGRACRRGRTARSVRARRSFDPATLAGRSPSRHAVVGTCTAAGRPAAGGDERDDEFASDLVQEVPAPPAGRRAALPQRGRADLLDDADRGDRRARRRAETWPGGPRLAAGRERRWPARPWPTPPKLLTQSVEAADRPANRRNEPGWLAAAARRAGVEAITRTRSCTLRGDPNGRRRRDLRMGVVGLPPAAATRRWRWASDPARIGTLERRPCRWRRRGRPGRQRPAARLAIIGESPASSSPRDRRWPGRAAARASGDEAGGSPPCPDGLPVSAVAYVGGSTRWSRSSRS